MIFFFPQVRWQIKLYCICCCKSFSLLLSRFISMPLLFILSLWHSNCIVLIIIRGNNTQKWVCVFFFSFPCLVLSAILRSKIQEVQQTEMSCGSELLLSTNFHCTKEVYIQHKYIFLLLFWPQILQYEISFKFLLKQVIKKSLLKPVTH